METRNCPYCNAVCEADWVDVGVGMVQCGPFHCLHCFASEIGPHDNYINPFRNYTFEEPTYVENPTKSPRVLTERESDTGWYEPNSPPGSSANVIGGKVVSANMMKATYQREFKGNPLWESKDYVEEWWENIRSV